MMAAAQRHGELVADLAAERPALREAQVVGVGRLPAADQARLLGNDTGRGLGRGSAAAPGRPARSCRCFWTRRLRTAFDLLLQTLRRCWRLGQ